MDSAQKPLELILARNLLTSVSTPALLVDDSVTMLFYNEAAAALLGRSFEETGQLSAEEWTQTFGPFDDGDEPLDLEATKLMAAVRAGRPAHGCFRISTANDPRELVEAAAFPIVAAEQARTSGAMIMFWPRGADANGAAQGE